jgi:hypothetical protein
MTMSVQTTYSSAPATGYAGTLDTKSPHHVLTMKNVESSASIAFGYGVCFDLVAPASDLSALLPALESNTVAGIVLHSHAYEREWTDSDGNSHGDLDADGLKPGALMNVLRKGRVLVVAEDAVAVGDRLWVRCTTGGAGEVLGGLTNADEGTETIDCTKQGVWMSSASAGGLAWLEVDFTAKP